LDFAHNCYSDPLHTTEEMWHACPTLPAITPLQAETVTRIQLFTQTRILRFPRQKALQPRWLLAPTHHPTRANTWSEGELRFPPRTHCRVSCSLAGICKLRYAACEDSRGPHPGPRPHFFAVLRNHVREPFRLFVKSVVTNVTTHKTSRNSTLQSI